MTQMPYRDSSLSVQERVADLLSRMTIDEKAGQLCQYFYFGAFAELVPGDQDDDVTADDGPLQEPQEVEDALARGAVGSLLFVTTASEVNRLQRMTIEGNAHGIPALFGFDVIHGFRTIFPVPIALAASWDPVTIERSQAVAAREARAVGIHWSFAPMVDIARDPRWGRIVEGAGEDPYLGAAVAAAQVRGLQGPTLGTVDRVIAGTKHLAGYGAARGGRDYEEADISDSELWNVYLPPFQAAINAGAGNIMSAYMDLNGIPASGNKWLLTDVLRATFGFEGFIVSDANAVRSLEIQHFAADLTDAAARAVNSGLDMEMCILDPAYSRLPDAVEQGLVTVEAIDDAVRRVLSAKFTMGLFENPFVDAAAAESVLGDAGHRDDARRAAERSAVLLKNDGLLPLDAGQLKSIAVIGDLADSKRDTIGPWVFVQDEQETVTVLDGIRARAGDDVRVEYAVGVRPALRVFPSMWDAMDGVVASEPEDFDDDAELAHAVEIASAADVAVVLIGQPQNMIGEFASTSTLELPGRQLELLKAVAATDTPAVAVVMSGRPLDLRWPAAELPSILQVWYPGTQGGAAVANLLFGDAVPGGKLPFTWPRTVGQVPLVYSHYRTFQPENQGTRYWDEASTPLFAFGHGLSYTTFDYDNLTLDRDTIAAEESIRISVDVTNTGNRAGDEVVQLYIHQRHGGASRPVRELKGFERITLASGEMRSVAFHLGADDLRYWNAATRDWANDATTIDVWVGGSSTADLASSFTVGPRR